LKVLATLSYVLKVENVSLHIFPYISPLFNYKSGFLESGSNVGRTKELLGIQIKSPIGLKPG
jgi:hypothetical protein